jgi:hypothetical protein
LVFIVGFLAGIAISFAIFITIWIYRYNEAIRASSITFSFIIVVGSCLIFTSILYFINSPTNENCHAQLWLQLVGFALIVGSLIVKEIRVYIIFSSASLNKKYLQDFYLLIPLGFLTLIQVVILI